MTECNANRSLTAAPGGLGAVQRAFAAGLAARRKTRSADA
jgi:hypothetical protein